MASTATVYAPGARPSDFRDHIYLYTEGEEVACVVDGAPPGPNGRLFIVPTGKSTRVPWEAGRFILDHLAYTGVVRVTETEREDGSGTDTDIKSAKAASIEALKEHDERRWRDYVTYVVNDKLDNKKVVPPPPDSIRRIMDRRGYRLEDFGVNIQGDANKDSAKMSSMEQQNRTLSLQNELLLQKIAEMDRKFNEVFGDAAPQPEGKGKKGG